MYIKEMKNSSYGIYTFKNFSYTQRSLILLNKSIVQNFVKDKNVYSHINFFFFVLLQIFLKFITALGGILKHINHTCPAHVISTKEGRTYTL